MNNTMGIVIRFPVGKTRGSPDSPLGVLPVPRFYPWPFTPWRAVALGMEMWIELLNFWTRPNQAPRRGSENVVSFGSAKAHRTAATGGIST